MNSRSDSKKWLLKSVKLVFQRGGQVCVLTSRRFQLPWPQRGASVETPSMKKQIGWRRDRKLPHRVTPGANTFNAAVVWVPGWKSNKDPIAQSKKKTPDITTREPSSLRKLQAGLGLGCLLRNILLLSSSKKITTPNACHGGQRDWLFGALRPDSLKWSFSKVSWYPTVAYIFWLDVPLVVVSGSSFWKRG